MQWRGEGGVVKRSSLPGCLFHLKTLRTLIFYYKEEKRLRKNQSTVRAWNATEFLNYFLIFCKPFPVDIYC